ncbi:hypothetical protein [Psychromicrobium xiongbiense]|uniref:hypothetical protein n=1 Tax=Psychromicrobium xiongbiense TaxID=3051184 RepID=UPI003075C6CE
MFTDLDKLTPGDVFIITVFGRVLAYRIFDKRVWILPRRHRCATGWSRPGHARHLYPLGINTQRILVTGERITPTPDASNTLANTQTSRFSFPGGWSGGVDQPS